MDIKLSDGRVLRIAVNKKNVKNIRLCVKPDGDVSVSAPFGVTDERILDFVLSKRVWLEKHLPAAEQQSEDDCLIFLGIKYVLEVVKDRRNGVALNDEKMTVFCNNPSDYKRVIQKWWLLQAQSFLTEAVGKWYPVLGQAPEEKPEIKVRKMKTLWGSCTSAQRTIRFNYYLMCASPTCIEYVVLHELAHLIYPNHGPSFKAFLSNYMPDWKERKRRLQTESAGIKMA